MKQTNKIILFFLFFSLFFTISCRSTFDLRNEKDAALQIVEDIQSKKIVFLGDTHAWAFPPQFIAENLEDFYKAGVRYIFLEEKSGYYLKNPEQYNSFVYPPWCEWGFRQEYHVLTDEITRLNNVYKADPLIVVWPEEENVFTDEELADTHMTLNKRDKTAQKVIIDIMDNTDKKGLIFYGSAHGLKHPTVWDSTSKEPYWTMTGVYLNEHYGNDFSTFRFIPFYSDKNITVLYQNKNESKIQCKSVSGENLTRFLELNGAELEYNHYCLCQNYIWAVPEFYIPEEINLKYLLSLFKGEKLSDVQQMDVWLKKSEQLLAIYYLKYHLGAKFDFDWTMPEEKLYEALGKIGDEDLFNIPYDLKKMENYISWLHSGIEDYVFNYPECLDYIEGDLPYYERDMKQAQKLNPADIWPLYWTAYFQTDNAIVSDNKKDYKIALKSWEKLFENDLFYASPVIKLSYEKAALCAEKSEETENSAFYEDKAENVNSLLNIDFKYYGYYGY